METVRFMAWRFLQSLFALFCIITITFFLARAIPGSPFLDEKAVPAHLIDLMKAKYGTDQPLQIQYLRKIKSLLSGDLGPSYGNKGFTVNEIISQSWPVSALIGTVGLALALSIGIPIGVLAAANANTRIDYTLMTLAMAGICLPTFVIGPLLAKWLALEWKWLDVAGFENSTAWILASLTLGLYYSAYIARLTRGSMLDVLSRDFIRTATAKGVSRMAVLFKHAFRGGISPVVAYLGPALASIIAGSFVVESIFGLPGLGQHFVKAVTNRDYPLIEGTVTLLATLVLIMNFIVDMVQVWLDPRSTLKS